MKKLISTTLALLLFLPLLANDGIYRSSGGVIYPVQESRISLEKEKTFVDAILEKEKN
ncbi:MAG: hypothetical protein R3B47_15685 [Bacteroidia bacterium]